MAFRDALVPAPERLFTRLELNPATGCWVWTGHVSGGYGRIRVDGTRLQVHRYAYELLIGPIPAGKVLDHIVCENQRCANPWHVTPVTNAENVLRGQSPRARQKRQTHCIHGHEFAGANLRRRPNGKRECRTCIADRRRARRAENRDAINAAKRDAYRRRVAA